MNALLMRWSDIIVANLLPLTNYLYVLLLQLSTVIAENALIIVELCSSCPVIYTCQHIGIQQYILDAIK